MSLLERFGFGADVSSVTERLEEKRGFTESEPVPPNKHSCFCECLQNNSLVRAQELCESRVEVAALKPHIALYHKTEIRSCVKVEVAVLGSPFLIFRLRFPWM